MCCITNVSAIMTYIQYRYCGIVQCTATVYNISSYASMPLSLLGACKVIADATSGSNDKAIPSTVWSFAVHDYIDDTVAEVASFVVAHCLHNPYRVIVLPLDHDLGSDIASFRWSTSTRQPWAFCMESMSTVVMRRGFTLTHSSHVCHCMATSKLDPPAWSHHQLSITP